MKEVLSQRTRRQFWGQLCFWALASLWSLSAPGPQPASREPADAKTKARVLLVTGVDYPGHLWKQTAPVLAEILRKDPRLGVTVIEDPHLLDSAAIRAYDAILLHFMNWEVPAPGEAARENLRSLVESGKGLMLVHFACGAWQDWPEFRKLAGRVWDPKLRGHDPRGPFRVEIADPDHPITNKQEPFETDDELYTCLTGDAPIRVVAKARSKVDGKDYPMAFALNYGRGRVFHTVLGHDVKAMSQPGVANLFRRGCAWAASLSAQDLKD
ncbi:MAG: ThuA domain-containing protein [Verrucomicrobia bacterium]|nr:ThuA domain-containing protein [Verrucomicrobiota bacterium]